MFFAEYIPFSECVEEYIFWSACELVIKALPTQAFAVIFVSAFYFPLLKCLHDCLFASFHLRGQAKHFASFSVTTIQT